jgi:flagellar basal-body rod protein FlgC
MDYRAVFEISAAGMGVEKKRLEVATLNLANMNSTAPAGTEGYRPLRVIAHAIKTDFGSIMDAQLTGATQVAQTLEVVPSGAEPRLVKDPGHPHADAQGFVRYPGVEQGTEMITAMTALRAYEANVAAVGIARAMATRALDIGGSR